MAWNKGFKTGSKSEKSDLVNAILSKHPRQLPGDGEGAEERRESKLPAAAQTTPEPEPDPGDSGGIHIHIQSSHAGRLHTDLGIKKGQKIPQQRLLEAKGSADPAERKRATFALNAKQWNK